MSKEKTQKGYKAVSSSRKTDVKKTAIRKQTQGADIKKETQRNFLGEALLFYNLP